MEPYAFQGVASKKAGGAGIKLSYLRFIVMMAITLERSDCQTKTN